jgi:DNA-binding XRE family transcriptional regulator
MANAQIITTPSGEKMVMLSLGEYEDLMDGLRCAEIKREIDAGRMETFTSEQVDAYLAAPTPLAFWRKHRELTQAALAQAVGVSQAYLAQVETGKRDGTVQLLAKLAHRLGVKLDDLVVEEEASN